MSTSGISTLDTASEVTQSKGEASPSSDLGSADDQQKEISEETKENTADDAKEDNDGAYKDVRETDKIDSGEEADKSTSEADDQQLPESERTYLPSEDAEKEADEQIIDHGFEDEKPAATVCTSSEVKEGTPREEPSQITSIQKCRHISSSESSSDCDKLGDPLTITEIAENSGTTHKLHVVI